jgi:hypothetical protein
MLMVFVCMGCEGSDELVREDAGGRTPTREAGAPAQPGVERDLDAGFHTDEREPSVDARVEPAVDARVEEVHVALAPRDWKPHASWTCGMPEGIPDPSEAPLAFTARFATRASRDVGRTPVGQRHLRELGDGTVTGDALEATLLAGGFESAVTSPTARSSWSKW